MLRWDEVEGFLVDEAARDLADGQQARPCLVAFSGEAPLLTAFLRPFTKGAYSDPIIELVALAAPLDADRLALSLSARVWSLRDPVAPVIHGAGDLRQQAVVIHSVDGAGGRARDGSALHPYDLVAGAVVWRERVDPGGAEGWITDALRLAVDERAKLRAPLAEVRRQALRCLRLGHLLALAPEVGERLGLGQPPATSASRRCR